MPLSYQQAIALLDSIPGINQRIAEIFIAEVGTDMQRFPTAGHLASWVGICPGNHESAGKRLSGKTRRGSPRLRSALVEAAHAAVHAKDSYLSAQYQCLALRRGGKKAATIAVGHTLLVIIYHLLSEKKDYQVLGGNYFDNWDRQAIQKRLVHRLEKLGYEVTLQSPSPTV